MHTPKSRLGIAAASIVLAAGAALGGDPNPPPGPVAPTMVTLKEVEPRIILDRESGSVSSVHRITAPGLYVATGNVVVPAGKHGILIDLPPGTRGVVTIDLNHFEIQGQPGSLDGVRKDGAVVACDFNLHDGRIVGMGGDGVHLEGLEGAGIAVSVDECGGDGMDFLAIPTVSAVAIKHKAPPPTGNNRVSQCGGNGIVARQCGDVAVDVTVQDCDDDGIHIEECATAHVASSVDRCGGDGVEVVDATWVEFKSAEEQLKGNPRHRVADSGGNGIVVSQCDNVEISGYRISGSGGGGGGGVPGAGVGLKFGNVGLVAADDVVITDSLSHGVEIDDCGRTSLRAVRLSNIGGNGLHATASTHGRWIEISDWSWDIEADTVAGDGIHISGISTVRLLGGSLSNCGGDGVHIEDGAVAGDKFVQVRGFQVELCAGDGMEIECDELTMADCITQGNGGNGVYGKNIRKNITVTLHKSHRNSQHGLLVSDGGARGVLRQQGKSTQVTRSNISNNRAAGVYVETSGSLSMEDVDCDGNDQEGVFALLLPALGSVQEKAKQVRCRMNNNGFGTGTVYPGVTIQGAVSFEMREVECSGNAGSGISVADFNRDGRLDLVTCSSNGGHGIEVLATGGLPNGRIRANDGLCDGNGGAGMFLEGTTGGEIADCTASNNGTGGIFIFGSSHVVRGNSCTGNGGPPLLVPVPGNVVGPLVDEVSVAGNCNPGANYVD